MLTEVEKMRKYVMTHNDAAKGEKWSRVVYEVTVKGDGSDFECLCGQFKHMGMLYSHVLRVRNHEAYRLFSPVKQKHLSSSPFGSSISFQDDIVCHNASDGRASPGGDSCKTHREALEEGCKGISCTRISCLDTLCSTKKN
jgi:hypothetical protein